LPPGTGMRQHRTTIGLAILAGGLGGCAATQPVPAPLARAAAAAPAPREPETAPPAPPPAAATPTGLLRVGLPESIERPAVAAPATAAAPPPAAVAASAEGPLGRELKARLAPLDPAAADRAGPEELARWLDRLDGAADVLRPRAALGVGRLCFCRRVEGFGVFDPLPDDHRFRPGECVELYAEFRNFTCEPAGPGGGHRTRLAGRLELRDAAGKAVLGPLPFDRADESRTPRRDFHRVYSFRLPPALPPGTYALHLEVTDVATDRTARRTLGVRVAASEGDE
jgi:hypothetical protein